MLVKGKLLIAGLAASFFVSSCGNVETVGKDKELKTKVDSVSYAFGVDVGSNINRSLDAYVSEETTIDKDLLIAAFAKAIKGEDTKIKADETMQVIRTFLEGERTKKEAEMKKKGVENLEKGKKFLEENKKKEGVITLESGLQYQVLKEGKGEKPGLTDKVKCHYHGTLIDGTVFDSSVERKEPMEFPVNGVIKGWTEALQLMPVGSKWKLFVPAELAYGERQAGEKILPNSTLIFEVELLEVAKSKK
ncbi:FKBP-type peptidyl-prolyl cis-trans isomerase [Prolixibacteraceae bacterium JC049]|nr:FKBP-type peptidyl-prolyl cis-trans isomerase [Prolixibacteraceae bacterium JC049]